MGNRKSNVRVNASVTVQGRGCPVDSIELSYGRRRSCWGGRRRLVAAFSFPRHGWREVASGEAQQNFSAKAAVVPLGHLMKKDGSRAVQVSCLSGGVPVYRCEVTVADLLQRLALTTRGKEAAVFFSLSGGKTKEGNTHFSALFCNGRRCGDGAATPADTPHRRHPVDCQPEAAISSDHEEDGEGHIHEGTSVQQHMEQDDAVFEAFDASNNSAWSCEDGDEKEHHDDHKDEQDDAVFRDFDESNDSAWSCEDDHEKEWEKEKQVEVAESSVMDSLGYIAGAVAVLLVLYNAWQEYSSH